MVVTANGVTKHQIFVELKELGVGLLHVTPEEDEEKRGGGGGGENRGGLIIHVHLATVLVMAQNVCVLYSLPSA